MLNCLLRDWSQTSQACPLWVRRNGDMPTDHLGLAALMRLQRDMIAEKWSPTR
jgi:hypothetical protein